MYKKSIFLLTIFTLTFYGSSFATESPTIDEQINDAIAPFTQFMSDIVFYAVPIGNGLSIPLILVWLFCGALFCTIYLRLINITGFIQSINTLRGKYTDKKHPGEVTHFQAFTTAVSGTIGLGNIAGVAVAISLGGPGATFWMILAGFLGMSTKFAECTLAVTYRHIHKDGKVSGGPMYFLKNGFSKRGWKKSGSFLASMFAVLCFIASFGGGNMFQSNQAVSQVVSLPFLEGTFIAGNSWFVGLIIAGLVALTIIGGIKSIARVTSRLVPLMCVIYALAVLVVIGVHFDQVPAAFGKIFHGAFSGEAIYGGIIGAMIQGMRRALFSNEAGIGSAAIAHSAVKTDEPVTEGFVANLEPFLDTVVVCTMTALVIIITGSYQDTSANGIQLTSMAFASVISWFPYVLSLIVVLFAFSTMISWSYYGLKSWSYLFGTSRISSNIYKLLFCTVIVIGSSLNLSRVVDFSDAMNFAMSIPNLIGIYVLIPEVRQQIVDFYKKRNLKLAFVKV